MKKLFLLLLALMVLATAALAEIAWPPALTPAQQQLQDYIGRVNETLQITGGGTIDVLHDLYPAFADLGMDGMTLPEDPFAEYNPPAEISVTLTDAGLHILTLRMQDANRFAQVAAACIHSASPRSVSLESATAIASAYAGKVNSNPGLGFEESVNANQGAQPRAYFAYYPDQYKDLRNWLQLTLVFALPGSGDAPVIVPGSTPPPAAADGVWLSQDNYSHLEIFPSPTPEPDSAAME